MRNPHRVAAALALSGSLALVHLANVGSWGGAGTASPEWATAVAGPLRGATGSEPRKEDPAAVHGSVRRRHRAAQPPSERLDAREPRAARQSAPEPGWRESDGEPARRPERRAAPSWWDAPIEFDAVFVPAGALSVAVTGVDWGAPRELVLWRTNGEEYARLATARSLRGGHFDFGQVVVPDRGLELAVTALGAAPGPADWARGLRLDQRAPAPGGLPISSQPRAR
jgi:hypothetical protein